MDNHTILHVLSAKPEGGSSLYVNGIDVNPDEESMQKIVDLSFLAGKHKSPWYGMINGVFFAKGYFNNKDDHGNEMSFSYCSNTHRLDAGISAFLSEIKAIGYTLNAETSNCLESQNRKSRFRIIGIVAIVIAIVFVILLIVE